MPLRGSHIAPSWPRMLVAPIAVLLIVARFLPGRLWMVWDRLDGGWAAGLNAAVAHGLVFGRDIVFNEGPYGGLQTGLYDPATCNLVIAGGAIAGFAFAAGVLALAGPPFWLLTILALPLVRTTDALAFALPLPALLLFARVRRDAPPSAAMLIALFALLPALGLLPLVKGSFLAVTVLAAGMLCVMLWQAGRTRLAAAVPLLTAASSAVLWCSAGQPVAALPRFLAGTLRIIAGHNEAMSQPGPPAEAAGAVIFIGVFLALLASGARHVPRSSRLCLLGGSAALLFVVFKAGYVRQDFLHTPITRAALGLMFVLLGAWLCRPAAHAAALAAALLLLAGPFSPASFYALPWASASGLADEAAGAVRLLSDPQAMTAMAAQSRLAASELPWHPAGTADIYSAGQLSLFKTGLGWSPRPVFQSYNATTPALAALNAGHLRGAGAPDNVFFCVEPIDLRLAAEEDGLSWPVLLSAYDPAGYDAASGLAWLQRAKRAAPALPGPAIMSGRQRLDAQVALPDTAQPLWARIDAGLSLAGRLRALLWAAPRLNIRLTFADASRREFRIVPSMVQGGFLLSPLVSTTLDFLKLRQPPGDAANALPRPVSMALTSDPGQAWAWRDTYGMSLAPIAFPPLVTRVAVQGATIPQPTAMPPTGAANDCALDRVDGARAPAALVASLWPIRLSGWALFDRAPARAADQAAIAFQAADGATFAIPAPPVPRGDVIDAFGLPQGALPGFDVTADLSRLAPGRYATFALASLGGSRRACRLPFAVTVVRGGVVR